MVTQPSPIKSFKFNSFCSYELVRKSRWLGHFAKFFSAKCVKTTDLPADKNYLFAVFPHGMIRSVESSPEKNHFSHRRSHVLIPNLGSPTENCRVRLGGLSIRSALRRCMNSTSLIDHFPFPALEPSATLPPATRSSGSCTQASARESAPSTTTSCVRSIANWCCRGD